MIICETLSVNLCRLRQMNVHCNKEEEKEIQGKPIRAPFKELRADRETKERWGLAGDSRKQSNSVGTSVYKAAIRYDEVLALQTSSACLSPQCVQSLNTPHHTVSLPH